MTIIRQQDVIQSVADALQYISYYHPADFIKAVKEAYDREESQSAKDAMAQIYENNLWGGNRSEFYSGLGSHYPEIVNPYIAVVSDFLIVLKRVFCLSAI